MPNLPAPVVKWMTILLPPIALLICCAVMVPRQNKLRETRKDVRLTHTQVEKYLTQLGNIKKLPKDSQIATLPMGEAEQSDFLRTLTGLCMKTGNSIVSVSSLAAPPPPQQPKPGNGPTVKPPADALPDDIIEIRSTIVFEGGFTQLRSFLAGLQRWPRLIALSDCNVTVGKDGYPYLQSKVSVARYVDAPPGWIPVPAPDAKQAQTESGSTSG